MKPAAIAATLVDVRNIAAHKCVRLEVHVPVEQAPAIMAVFGWPTMVEPVHVAIARLEPEAATPQPKVEKPRQRWESLPLSQQAAMRCGEQPFIRFLCERGHPVSDADGAANYIRSFCGVESRSDIGRQSGSAEAWKRLDSEYQFWLRVYA